MSCVVNSLDTSQEAYIKSTYQIAGTKADPQFLADFTRLMSTQSDCIRPNLPGLNIPTTSYTTEPFMTYNILRPYLPEIFNACPFDHVCEDSSCAIPESTCVTYGRFQGWTPVNTTMNSCLSVYTCNWNPTICNNSTTLNDCSQACGAGYFCGVCENDHQCLAVTGLNANQCNASTVCFLPNGATQVNITNAACTSQSNALCTVDCGTTCRSTALYSNGTALCYTTALSQGQCTSSGGSYDAVTHVCRYPGANRATCATINATYEDCSTLNIEACYACEHSLSTCPVNQVAMMCQRAPVKCADATKCNNVGTCSDSVFLDKFSSTSGERGVCLIPRRMTDQFSPYYQPFCSPGTITYLNGCILDDSTVNRSSCDAQGGTWLTPAANSTQCLQTYACEEVFNEEATIGIQYAYSPKSQQDCAVNYILSPPHACLH